LKWVVIAIVKEIILENQKDIVKSQISAIIVS
jgi:hypothetical protein